MAPALKRSSQEESDRPISYLYPNVRHWPLAAVQFRQSRGFGRSGIGESGHLALSDVC